MQGPLCAVARRYSKLHTWVCRRLKFHLAFKKNSVAWKSTVVKHIERNSNMLSGTIHSYSTRPCTSHTGTCYPKHKLDKNIHVSTQKPDHSPGLHDCSLLFRTFIRFTLYWFSCIHNNLIGPSKMGKFIIHSCYYKHLLPETTALLEGKKCKVVQS